MFVLPLYIAFLWTLVWHFRRRWVAFVMLIAGVVPIALFSVICIHWLRLKPTEGPPTWLYFLAAVYSVLFLLGGMIIACSRRVEAAHPCHRCGYDLMGLAAPTPCPECGTAIRQTLPRLTVDPAHQRTLAAPSRVETGVRARRFAQSRLNAVATDPKGSWNRGGSAEGSA